MIQKQLVMWIYLGLDMYVVTVFFFFFFWIGGHGFSVFLQWCVSLGLDHYFIVSKKLMDSYAYISLY